MTQEQIDSIRERMCDEYCQFPHFTLPQQVIEAICNACPLAELEAEPKKGQWIKDCRVLTSNPPKYIWNCSECGYPKIGFSVGILEDHCPACGTKMEASE